MRTSFFPHSPSSFKPQTLSQRQNATPTFRGDTPHREGDHPFDRLMRKAFENSPYTREQPAHPDYFYKPGRYMNFQDAARELTEGHTPHNTETNLVPTPKAVPSRTKPFRVAKGAQVKKRAAKVKVDQTILSDPEARWSQLSPTEKATLLTIIAAPKHVRLQTKALKDFLQNQYNYDVNQTTIQTCQSALEKDGAKNLYSHKNCSPTEEKKLRLHNQAVLKKACQRRDLNPKASLIKYENQQTYKQVDDSSNHTSDQDFSDDEQSREPSPLSGTSSHHKPPKASGAQPASSNNPFQVDTAPKITPGRKLTLKEKKKALEQIKATPNMTEADLIEKRLVGNNNSALYLLGLMQYCSNDKERALRILTEAPSGNISVQKKRDLITFLTSQPKDVNDFYVMEHSQVALDTVVRYKDYLKDFDGNLNEAFAKFAPEKAKPLKKQKP